MSDLNKIDEKISRKLDEGGEDNLITLSTGVVLMARPANPTMLIRAMTANPAPTPPLVFMEAMGRSIENPDDPDYIERKQAWSMTYSAALLNVLISLGTDLVSVPNGMEGPHPVKPKKGMDEKMPQWILDYQILGFPIFPTSPSWRYMIWVQFIAAPLDTDMKLIQNKVMALSGVREAAVRDVETFPKSD